MDLSITWQLLALILVITGILFTVLPPLPGPLMVLGGLLLAAWADGFVYLGWFTWMMLAMIALLTYVVDALASALGARKTGASPQAIWGAALGGLLGLFFGLPGILLGPFVGAMALQYLHDRDMMRAGKVGVGAWIGMAVGTALKLAMVFLMVGIYIFARYI